MLKPAIILCSLFLVIFMCGCGGGTTSAANSAIYDLPAALAPNNKHMGGAIQGTALVLTKTVSTVAGTAGIIGLTDGIQSAASFYQPVGIATDGTNLYVADSKYNLVRKINIASKAVTRLAGSSIGLAGYADSTDGTGNTATFSTPTAITVSGTYLYVADTGSNMIRRVDSVTGKTEIFAGSTTGIAGSTDSKTVPTDAKFSQPTGITTDGANLYVTDYGNHTIRRINIATRSVTTMAGAPNSAGSVDGSQSVARFNQPARITTDGKRLYVTDFMNRTIRKIDIATGAVTTIAGFSGPLDSAGNIADSSDGTGATARFNQPNGITTDGTYLYVTDSYNNSVRRIELSSATTFSGPVTTILSGSYTDPGSTDGVGSAAKFNTPIGITTDGTALFIADSQNHTIRMVL